MQMHTKDIFESTVAFLGPLAPYAVLASPLALHATLVQNWS